MLQGLDLNKLGQCLFDEAMMSGAFSLFFSFKKNDDDGDDVVALSVCCWEK